MLARFRRLYGADPLHLLALLASFAVSAAAIVRWFDFSGPDTLRVLVWFGGAIVAHDLVLLPFYSLLDRIAFGRRGRAGAAPARTGDIAYVRIPALLSGLLLLVFYPEIFRLGNATFRTASGQTQTVYLVRWLLASVAMFAVSAIAWAAAHRRLRRPHAGDRDPRRARSRRTRD
jgi:hypothetical protein